MERNQVQAGSEKQLNFDKRKCAGWDLHLCNFTVEVIFQFLQYRVAKTQTESHRLIWVVRGQSMQLPE